MPSISLLSANGDLDPALIETLQAWLLATPADNVNIDDSDSDADEVEIEAEVEVSSDDDPEGRSLLWGHSGFSFVPGRPFPVLHALVRHFLVTGNHEALRSLIGSCLSRGFKTRVWAHLLPVLRYLRPPQDGDTQPATDVLAAIIRRYPALVGTHELAVLFGHVHWWTPELVERELPHWGGSDLRSVRQGYGELVALLAILHPERKWAKSALGEIERSDDADAKAGAVTTAVNLWPDQPWRAAATDLLVRFTPSASDAEWKAIFDLFRIVDELLPDESTALLLEVIADNAAAAPTVDATFIVERLQSLLPHEAPLVARLATILVGKWHKDLADIRTGTAAHASELVDLAITLHRLGPATREEGTQLFEMLLDIDAYEARSTLDQIDSRFRPTAPVKRPRLQRRKRAERRQRRGA